jgi:hypothetical protein
MKITHKSNINLDLALKGIENKVGKVGFFKGSIYDNGIPVAYVATIQEFGVPEKGIPARSFMRSTINEQQKNWSKIAEQGSRRVLSGKLQANDLMEMIGQKASGDMRKKISTITTPALKQSTINARMSKRADKTTVGNLTKPLVDSGLMLQSLTYVVEDK